MNNQAIPDVKMKEVIAAFLAAVIILTVFFAGISVVKDIRLERAEKKELRTLNIEATKLKIELMKKGECNEL